MVASQLGITNGHAARMRFSRFKQHMEGVPTAPRKPRSNVPRPAKVPKRVKAEVSKGGREDLSGTAPQGERKPEARVKAEPGVVDLPQACNGVIGSAAADQVGLSSLSSRDEQDQKPSSQLLQRSVLRPSEALFSPGRSSFRSPDQVLVKREESWDD